jgi:C-terminal processing protease CtpA/Prc
MKIMRFLMLLILISHTIIAFSQSNVLYQKDFKKEYINIKYSKSQIAADKVLSYIVPSGITWKHSLKSYKAKKSAPFFQGKLCVLIGMNTFSSANLLANAIQDYNLTTLIGENTGEPCNDYGDMISFMLPNTQLISRAPFKQFIRANGRKEDKNSVIPDYKVVPSNIDIKGGKDNVLDFAKDWIIKNN